VLHDENNNTMVGMYDFLLDTHTLEKMLLNVSQQGELGVDSHIANSFFESLKFASITLSLDMGQGLPN
jgi:hypothetical protein